MRVGMGINWYGMGVGMGVVRRAGNNSTVVMEWDSTEKVRDIWTIEQAQLWLCIELYSQLAITHIPTNRLEKRHL